MSIDSRPHPAPFGAPRPWRRTATVVLVISVVVGMFFLAVDLYGVRPQFYQPARGTLTDVALILSQAAHGERDLLERYQNVHRQLEHAIALLDETQRMDPEDRQEIAALRTQLTALEEPGRMTAADPGDLQRRYQGVIRRLNTLADRLAQPGS